MNATGVTDLRSYLEVLEQAGELSRVGVPVSLDQEIGAICLRNLRAGGPGLLFEKPGDCGMPLAVDLLASRRRYALALGMEPDRWRAISYVVLPCDQGPGRKDAQRRSLSKPGP